MKILSNTFLKKVSPTEINDLTKDIPETLDIEVKKNHKKVFTNVDLWNINKNRRNFSDRKFVY